MKRVFLLPHAEKRRLEYCPHISERSIRANYFSFLDLLEWEVNQVGITYSHTQQFKVHPLGDFVFIAEHEKSFVTIVTIIKVQPRLRWVLRQARQNR